MTTPLVTIVIPNYKTPELVKLCLRLIRKNTDKKKIKVVVIDNDSQDESMVYLRSLDWITFLSCPHNSADNHAVAHGIVMDMGLAQVDTPYVLSIHTDTLVKRMDWLEFLLNYIENKPQVAGVGSWKLELKSWPEKLLKKIEQGLQLSWYKLIDKKNHVIQGKGKNYYYLRSHCALYRADLLKKYGLKFSMVGGPPGKAMHQVLVNEGYDMVFLDAIELSKYIDHINHATLVLNPQLGSRKKTIIQGRKRIEKALKALQAEKILQDDSLDKW